MTDKEAMKLALFALEIVKTHFTQNRHVNEAITALKERLAQPEHEPVVCEKCGKAIKDGKVKCVQGRNCWVGQQPAQRTEQEPVIDKSAAIRIATALGWEPKREWVGLTRKEVHDLWVGLTRKEVHDLYDSDYVVFHQRIEAKLKEKNT